MRKMPKRAVRLQAWWRGIRHRVKFKVYVNLSKGCFEVYINRVVLCQRVKEREERLKGAKSEERRKQMTTTNGIKDFVVQQRVASVYCFRVFASCCMKG